jgi:hypothetical protein
MGRSIKGGYLKVLFMFFILKVDREGENEEE